ncbi:VOC family protein [Aliikangiella coralliicola]|uniref:VOC domain-containing protein n=1 Tax=Aliikangiella coralliicola TaxID=2592383 RepID=A0A545UHM7_9GAMM|nr:VOC family protein [Aliikangiella coralliicola]TQV88913.1 hypothetical protein FLL46_05090 [Aliikangiella coralliicola]
MDIDHVCIAVRNIDKTGEHLSRFLGYSAKTRKVTNTRQKVVVQFYQKPGSIDIKLIEPSSKDSPLIPFLKKGEGLHHLGMKVDKVDKALNELSDLGAIINTQPEPGEAFDDEQIAFTYLGGGLNIEIFDTDKRRDLLTS